jgi:hypothetical protein
MVPKMRPNTDAIIVMRLNSFIGETNDNLPVKANSNLSLLHPFKYPTEEKVF